MAIFTWPYKNIELSLKKMGKSDKEIAEHIRRHTEKEIEKTSKK